ncbi:endospore germination permease [Paenibacillus sp. CGMCC 1.16610]|uniref:Endospore germination permease n=1 Tax=Paenibacillus anseongense TaxID=2682845 RepID=A0ABW9U921_9BACL|nr:endospore germination permease [Paenibacillus sp. CGMCC 1.16610]MBA2937569.1 endospore germination permease [Paenibacillus sp. CGMCC 1.16610]MVQ36627.1 endospore germination permease [Paenibacillus anseongense]
MKITRWQLFWMFTTLEISMSIWLTVSPTIETARQDAWISLLLAGVIGIAVTLILVLVSQRHSAYTLVEFAQKLCGKWVGKLIAALYIMVWFSVSADILRIFSLFIKQFLFHDTPIWVIAILMVSAMVYINYAGNIEAIARFSELAGPLLLIGILITFGLNVTNLHPELILPVFADSGAVPILKGSFVNASFLGESMMIMMLTPFIVNSQKMLKPALLAICVPSLVAVLTAIFVVMTFGTNIGSTLIYPYFSMVRFINYLEFIQNMDVWIMFIWIFSVFVKLAIYLFINSYGTAQLLGIKNWRILIGFAAVVIFAISLTPANIIGLLDYAKLVWIIYIFPIFIVGLPILLLFISFLRGRSLAHE